MFTFAILTGIFSYLVFFLGLAGLLYKEAVILVTFVFIVILLVRQLNKETTIRVSKIVRPSLLLVLFVILFILQAIVNVFGVLGPELSFDALWYHLTLPKLYLASHSVFHIPGGLLYYSDMPKLGEMLYVAGLSFGNEIFVKVIHFLFGLLSAWALYLFARKFYSPFLSMIAVVIFYSNIVVAWESTTAYIDLIRTFYEILALWSFINWWETKKRKWFYLSAIMVGFAITTKMLAFGSLFVIAALIVYVSIDDRKSTVTNIVKCIFHYVFVALLIPTPWFIFSYINAGNPVYPFFSEVYKVVPEPVSAIGFVSEVWRLFTQASDPVSPIYAIFIPLIILFFTKVPKAIKIIGIYTALAIIIWYFTPRTGGGRFIVPYLPAFSILCVAVLAVLFGNKTKYGIYFSKLLIICIIFVSIVTIVYRSAAEAKYLPVIIGQQSKHDFLSDNLNFAYGDFYDTDNYFKNNIQPNERVLLFGFHNLYYVNFLFIDSSWVKKGDKFHYIAVQKTDLPDHYKDWQLIYSNDKTAVKLYKHRSQYEVIF